MKIEKLTDNKIRVIINIEELSKKNLDIHNLIHNQESSHSFFENLLKEADKQVGFDVQNCKLFIEAFSASDEYLILTLTKYKNEITSPTSSKRLKYKRKTYNNNYKNTIYKFQNFDEFYSFCTYCNDSKLGTLKQFAKNISLYEYNNFYYLIFTNINQNYENLNLFYTSISEFSNLESTSLVFKSKLQEYGKVIFKANAIQNAIKYFAKKM